MTVWKYKKELQTAMADVMNVLTQDACWNIWRRLISDDRWQHRL
jgi:hypothetical protein